MTADSPEQSDEGLEFVRSRCEEFYREPSISAYFNTRLAVLAAVNEHREQFVAWANEGVRFHELNITIPNVKSHDDTSDPPSANSDRCSGTSRLRRSRLQHHALETLLRLYTASSRHRTGWTRSCPNGPGSQPSHARRAAPHKQLQVEA